jgi:hypothetical protein
VGPTSISPPPTPTHQRLPPPPTPSSLLPHHSTAGCFFSIAGAALSGRLV